MLHQDTKRKVIEAFIRLDKAGLSSKKIAEEIHLIDSELPVYPAMLSRLKNENYKYIIENIDQYLRCLEQIERNLDTSHLPTFYFVGYFLDNDFHVRKCILAIWEETKKIKLSFLGAKTVSREGFFQINDLDKSIAFTTKDEQGENHAFIITHDIGKKLQDRELMSCVYAARFMGNKPVAGKMIFHKKENQESCEKDIIPDATFYALYQKRLQSKSHYETLDDTIEKIRGYVGVYKGYYFSEKEKSQVLSVGIGEIKADGTLHFKLMRSPNEYTGIVKVSRFADNLSIGINWEMVGEYYRYNWVLESKTFFEDNVLRGVYAGMRFTDNRPVGGKLILIRQTEKVHYADLQPYEIDFGDAPLHVQFFFKGDKYSFIEKTDDTPIKETDPRLEEIAGNYICYKLSAVDSSILAYPLKVEKNGNITKKGELESTQYGTAATFKGGAMLAITMHSEQRRKKTMPFFTHKLFFIGQHAYNEIRHITGVGTSVTNDEMAARCGREIIVTSPKSFEELNFAKYDMDNFPEEIGEIVRYLGGRMDNLIVESPSRVNKPLMKVDNIGKRYFHSACYNALKTYYAAAKEELINAAMHNFPADLAEEKELLTEFQAGCLAFFLADKEIMAKFGKYLEKM